MSPVSRPSTVPARSSSQAGKRKHVAEDEPEAFETKSNRGSKSRSGSPLSSTKRVRTIGPTLPPPDKSTIDEHNGDSKSQSSSGSDDDDDFGPSLPTATSEKGATSYTRGSEVSGLDAKSLESVPAKTQRDEWMVVPPSSGDWTSRVDPTQLKNRKFNTGKSSRGQGPNPATGANPGWTESSDEKVARLQREVLGVRDAPAKKDTVSVNEQAAQRENSRKLREYNETIRGNALYKQHQKDHPEEKEDDPSARPFDREKDIAAGTKITHTQKREMMHKAADFGSRFSSGKFL